MNFKSLEAKASEKKEKLLAILRQQPNFDVGNFDNVIA